jgi:hypothetical protein
MGGACNTYGERIVAYWVLVGKPEGKRVIESTGDGGGRNIKMNVQEIDGT